MLAHEEPFSSQHLQNALQFSSGTGQMEEAHSCLKAVCSDYQLLQKPQLQLNNIRQLFNPPKFVIYLRDLSPELCLRQMANCRNYHMTMHVYTIFTIRFFLPGHVSSSCSLFEGFAKKAGAMPLTTLYLRPLYQIPVLCQSHTQSGQALWPVAGCLESLWEHIKIFSLLIGCQISPVSQPLATHRA